MADNVVRHDVIELDFKTDLGSLNKVNDGMDKLKKSVAGVGKSDGLNKVKDGAKKTADAVKGLGDDAKKSTSHIKNLARTSLSKLQGGLKKLSTQLGDVAKKSSGAAYNGLKKMASVSFKALTAGLGAAATAVGALTKKAVSAFGDNEQLEGGVKTIFGTNEMSIEEYAKSVGKSVSAVKSKYKQLQDTENTVFKNANAAYKTAGLSANEYMETVTSFSASLLQSLGGDTKKAAAAADMAVIDMSDKMSVRLKCIEPYQGCGAEKQQEMVA